VGTRSILASIRASRLLHVIACAPVAALSVAAIALSPHAHAATTDPAAPRPFLVALDAGHGGSPDNNNPGQPYDSGAVGTNGLLEKDLALDEVMRVRRLLEAQGVDVLLTRDSDVFMDITPRMQKALDAHADLFVSIHFNGFTDPASAGSLVLYPKDSSQPFATTLANALARHLGTFGVLPDGLQYRPEMFQHAAMPTATIEPLFLTNATEAALMSRDDVRDAIARAVVDGIDAQAGTDIAARRAVADGWAAIAPAFHTSAGSGAIAVAPSGTGASPDPPAASLQPGGIVPLGTASAAAAAIGASATATATPIPVLGQGHADAALPSASAAVGAAGQAGSAASGPGGPLRLSTTPDPSPPWIQIALAICALAVLVVLRRPVIHFLARGSAGVLRGIAHLDGAEVPMILRVESRGRRRVARRRALIERGRGRGRPGSTAGRVPLYDEFFFRPAPAPRASRGRRR
jgi:N-acetylmuramoyl-L-alanine amidase